MPLEIKELQIAVQNAMRESDTDIDTDTDAENLAQIAAHGKVTVSGRDFINCISRIRLEQSVENHHRAVVRLNFTGNDAVAPETMAGYVGEQITIKIGDELYRDDSRFPISFAGLVTGVRIVSETASESYAVIIAQSPTVKLEFGHLNKTFLNQKASDMISATIGQAGLGGGTIDASSVTHEHVFQYKETNWDFARRMASSYGVFLFYDGEKLHATNAKSRPTNDIQRSDIGSLKMTLGATGNKVNVHGWDYKEKKAIKGKATGSVASGIDSRDSSTMRKAESIHTKEDFVAAGTAASKAHADVIAKTIALNHVQGLAKMTGQTCSYVACVGKNMRVDGYDSVLNGSYFVTWVRHELNESGQYSNRFEATPTNCAYPRILEAPLRENAVQSAIVTNNEDPDDLGRVKVKFPWREDEESFWARVSHVDAGADKGLYTIPDVDDEVLVGFEHGDFSRPVILGNLYNGVDQPIRPGSEMVDGGTNKLKVFKTKGGNEIVLDDTSGAEVITISQKDGTNTIVLTMDGPSISIISDGGDINLKGKAINIESESGDIVLKSGGKLTAQSQSDTEIKATGALKGQGMSLEMKGQTTGKIEASATLDLNGNAMVNVKGGMINLN